MTRSTELESESVNIARYELRNARRESLLSQNWTASEEENTNALLFDHEMIKISISTELNAWISTHETDDLVVFIKYMYQQHDIEIEIHNDMIQMLNDVNKINIELKAINIELKATQTTLNAVWTRLQKEIKKKNVIIRHSEATSSRLSTSIRKIDSRSQSSYLTRLCLKIRSRMWIIDCLECETSWRWTRIIFLSKKWRLHMWKVESVKRRSNT